MEPVNLSQSSLHSQVDLNQIARILMTPYRPTATIAIAQNLLKWNFTVFDSQLYEATSNVTALRVYLMMVPHVQTGFHSCDIDQAKKNLKEHGIVTIEPHVSKLHWGIQFGLKEKFSEIRNAVLEVLEHAEEIGLTPKKRVRFSLMVLKFSSDSTLLKRAFHELHQPELFSSIDPAELYKTVHDLRMLFLADRTVFYHPFLNCHKLPMGDKASEYRDLLLHALPNEDIDELISLLPLLDIPEENALALQNEPDRRQELRDRMEEFLNQSYSPRHVIHSHRHGFIYY